MASFYMTKDLSRFGEFWDRVVTRGAFEADPQVREMTSGFLCQVFRQHPDLMKGRLDDLDRFPERQRDTVRVLLWLINTDVSRDALKRNGAIAMLGKRPPPIQKREIYRKDDIDFCVGWFCASGDTDALKPLIAVIVAPQWTANDLRPKYAVINLQGICRRDVKIKMFVEGFLAKKDLSENARAALLEAIDRGQSEGVSP